MAKNETPVSPLQSQSAHVPPLITFVTIIGDVVPGTVTSKLSKRNVESVAACPTQKGPLPVLPSRLPRERSPRACKVVTYDKKEDQDTK